MGGKTSILRRLPGPHALSVAWMRPVLTVGRIRCLLAAVTRRNCSSFIRFVAVLIADALALADVADIAPRFRYNVRMPRADQPKVEPSSAVSPAIEAFIARWSPSGGGERSNYQLFLAELCDLLGVPKPEPAVADVAKNAYIFDRSIPRPEPDGSTTTNFIDLYKRGCFICETKQGVEAAANRGGDLPSPSPLGGERPGVRGTFARRGHGIRGSGSWDTAMEKARNQAEQYARALPAAEGRPCR